MIARNEATIGELRGKTVHMIKHMRSGVMGKHHKGGQSAARFERLIEISVQEFFKRVANLANEAFLGNEDLVGVIIGGPGATKRAFSEKDYLHHEIRKKVIGIVDTGYTDESGLRELLSQSEEMLAEEDLIKEKNLMQRFLREIRKEQGLFVYGEREVMHALETGAVDVLLVSEGLHKYKADLECISCGNKETGVIKENAKPSCPKCGNEMSVAEKKDMVDEYYELGESMGSTVELISTDSEEGSALLKTFGGIAAILRFRV